MALLRLPTHLEPRIELDCSLKMFLSEFDHPEILQSQPFASGLSSPVDLKVGPDGNLYYLVRGGGGGVFKIIYS